MNGVSRFLSRREKKGKGSAAEGKTHHTSKDVYRILHSDEKKKTDKEEEKKVKDILQRLQLQNITNLKEAQIEDALRSSSVNGDTNKAVALLLVVEDAVQGIVQGYNPEVKLLGAVNRENVTCYLDSLLFSMFARTDSFEGIIAADFPDNPRKKLVTLLRLWVNMLRTGKLITTDITQRLQQSLKECGWPEAALLRQQDVSEAFTFITGKLDLPLLTLKMDVYHTGKEDRDDHKIVRERLLDVAIPKPPEDGTIIKLEDCLESYFNNKIEVKRHLQRRNTVQSFRSIDKGQVLQVEAMELRPDSPSSLSPLDPSSLRGEPVNTRKRADSIFSHRRIEAGESSEKKTHDDIALRNSGRRRASTIRREVLMPAWQFFSLIPWYTHDHPKNDQQVAVHLETKRPVLGICLKRYSMTSEGVGTRLDTYIDIPLEIGLPHFISEDCGHGNEGFEPNFTNFKLSLQSVICHRGKSLDAGHYIALVRGEAPNAVTHTHLNGEAGSSQAQPESPWLRFDDLAKERITNVDIHQALKDECPYLLFYQVRPVDDEEDERGNPPTYDEATTDQSVLELSRVATESATTDTSASSSALPMNASKDTLVSNGNPTSTPAMLPVTTSTNVPQETLANIASEPILPLPVSGSSGVEQPKVTAPNATTRPKSIDLSTLTADVARASLEVPRGRTSFQSNRRSSITFTDSSINGSHKGGSSAPITPGDDADTKTGFLSSSRRNSISKGWLKAKSRPTSQSGDNRLSMSMSKLKNAMSKDKLGNLVPENAAHDGSTIQSENSPEKHKTTSVRRSKSLRQPKKRNRSSSLGRKLDDITNGKSKKAPDRECVIM